MVANKQNARERCGKNNMKGREAKSLCNRCNITVASRPFDGRCSKCNEKLPPNTCNLLIHQKCKNSKIPWV